MLYNNRRRSQLPARIDIAKQYFVEINLDGCIKKARP